MSHITCHTSHVTHHMSHITCHTSHVTHHMSHITCHKSIKTALDTLCDTILEMSPPQNQHGTTIHITGHAMCYITHHMSPEPEMVKKERIVNKFICNICGNSPLPTILRKLIDCQHYYCSICLYNFKKETGTKKCVTCDVMWHIICPVRCIAVPCWCLGGDISKMVSHKRSRAIFQLFVTCDVQHVTHDMPCDVYCSPMLMMGSDISKLVSHKRSR